MMSKYNPENPSNVYDQADYSALMRSTIPDAITGIPEMRFDSAEEASAFFARELDYIKSQSYDVEYPEFTALSLFPVSNEVNPGAETVTYYSYDKTGMAKIINNYATDLPRADAKGKPTTAVIKSIGSSYGYSVQEMRASRMAGKSLDIRKAESARYQIDYKNNQIAWAGDEETGIVGVLTPNNDIPLYVIPSNGKDELGNATTLWKYKDPDDILADINGMQAFTARITKNVERPDTLVLPADVFIDISTRQIPNTGFTIKRFILENAPYLKEIVPAAELQSDSADTNPYAAGDTPKAVGLLFKKDARKLTIENPLPFYQYPLQPQGLEVIVPCEARTAGAMIYYPLSLLIAVGI
jgi:hypothetical protein